MELPTLYSKCETLLLSNRFQKFKDLTLKVPQLFNFSHSGETLLHLACDNNESKVVKFLLKNNSDPNSQNLTGETALHISVFRGYVKIVKILVSFKADPYIKTFDNKSVFDYAFEFEEPSILSVLQGLHALENDSLHTDDYQLSVSASNEVVVFLTDSPEAYKSQTRRDQGVIVEETSIVDELNSPVERVNFFMSRISFTEERLKTKKVNFKEEFFDFLDRINMRKYFKVLICHGFDHLNGIFLQMKTNLLVNHAVLKNIGIEKPGDRSRIVVALEKDAVGVRVKENFTDFQELMEEVGLEIYLLEFKRFRIDNLAFLVENAFNASVLSNEILESKLRMKKIGHRMRFLAIVQYLSLRKKSNCYIL